MSLTTVTIHAEIFCEDCLKTLMHLTGKGDDIFTLMQRLDDAAQDYDKHDGRHLCEECWQVAEMKSKVVEIRGTLPQWWRYVK